MAQGGQGATSLNDWVVEPWLGFLEAALRPAGTPSVDRSAAVDAFLGHFGASTTADVGLGVTAFLAANNVSGLPVGSLLGWFDRPTVEASYTPAARELRGLVKAMLPDEAVDGVVTGEFPLSARGVLRVDAATVGEALDGAVGLLDEPRTVWPTVVPGQEGGYAQSLIPVFTGGTASRPDVATKDALRLLSWWVLAYNDAYASHREVLRLALSYWLANLVEYIGDGVGLVDSHAYDLGSAGFAPQYVEAERVAGGDPDVHRIRGRAKLRVNTARVVDAVFRVSFTRADLRELQGAAAWLATHKIRTLPSSFDPEPPPLSDLEDANGALRIPIDADGFVDVGPLAVYAAKLLAYAVFGTSSTGPDLPRRAFERVVQLVRSSAVIEALAKAVTFYDTQTPPVEIGELLVVPGTHLGAGTGVDATLTARVLLGETTNVNAGASVRARGTWAEAEAALQRIRTLLGISPAN